MSRNIDDIISDLKIDEWKDKDERVKKIKAAIHANKRKTGSKFPTEVFPLRCQEMILSYSRCFGAKPEHYGLAMLTVAGAALGNAAWVIERGKAHPPILYSVIVDIPNTGKSPTVETVLSPLKKIEKRLQAENTEKYREYMAAKAAGQTIGEPRFREFILNDFTLEKVYSILHSNPRGALVWRDELRGWLGSMNKYSAGSDETFWMEVWNGNSAKISRVKQGGRSMYIDYPFMCVIGTVQPLILKQFAAGTKANDGFLARMIFSYPDFSKKMQHNAIYPDRDHLERWGAMIEKIYSLPAEIRTPKDEFESPTIEPYHIELTEEAQKVYIEFYNKNTDQINESDDEVSQAMLGKFDSYCLRMAVILEVLYWAEVGPDDPTREDLESIRVTKKSMEGAVQLTEYFKYTALKVVDRVSSPIGSLQDEVKVWYKALPEEVTRAEALDIAKEVGLSRSKVDRMFNKDEPFFQRVRQGVYLKNFMEE